MKLFARRRTNIFVYGGVYQRKLELYFDTVKLSWALPFAVKIEIIFRGKPSNSTSLYHKICLVSAWKKIREIPF